MLDPNGRLPKILRWLRRWVGIPLALAVLLLIGQQICTGWTTIQTTVSQIRVGWFLAGMGVTALSITLLGWNWISILASRGIQACWPSALAFYLLTNLARYLPGGIWHFAGRTAWLVEQGCKLRGAIESLILEQAMVLASAGAIGFSLLGLAGRMALVGGLGIGAEIMLVLLAGIAVGWRPSHKGFSYGLRGEIWRWTLLVLSYDLFWIINGFSTICLSAAIVGWERMTPFICVDLVGQTALSWAAGYVVLFVPGGWGVREATFIYLLSYNFSGDIVVILPVLSRLAQILTESVYGAIFPPVWRLVERKRKRVKSYPQ
ncbi:MAG: hypothetical protein ACUVR2_11750 [Anaerolineae bacterium]